MQLSQNREVRFAVFVAAAGRKTERRTDPECVGSAFYVCVSMC